MRNLFNRGKYFRVNLVFIILNVVLFYYEIFLKYILCFFFEMRKEGGGVVNEYVMYLI